MIKNWVHSSQKIASNKEDRKSFGIYNFLNFFFPKMCLSCNVPISSKHFICLECYNRLTFVTPADINKHYSEYFSHSTFVSGLYSLINFEKDSPIQDLIHLLKYGSKPIIGTHLGNLFGEKYHAELLKLKIDLIIPVPLFHSKKAERGYNQSYQFANGISLRTGIKIASSAIKRIRKTETQTHLTREERNKNVENAFKVKSNSKLEGKNILVVDDVITTGSTINECIRLIKGAGSKKIYPASIALA